MALLWVRLSGAQFGNHCRKPNTWLQWRIECGLINWNLIQAREISCWSVWNWIGSVFRKYSWRVCNPLEGLSEDLTMVSYAFLGTVHLDYCHTLLLGLSVKMVRKFQLAQNAVTMRVLFGGSILHQYSSICMGFCFASRPISMHWSSSIKPHMIWDLDTWSAIASWTTHYPKPALWPNAWWRTLAQVWGGTQILSPFFVFLVVK